MALTLSVMVDRHLLRPWFQLALCALKNGVTSNNSVFFNLFPHCEMNKWTYIRSHKHTCLLGPGPRPKGTKDAEYNSLGRLEPPSQAAATSAF